MSKIAGKILPAADVIRTHDGKLWFYDSTGPQWREIDEGIPHNAATVAEMREAGAIYGEDDGEDDV